MEAEEVIVGGVNTVLQYDNIAIVVLMVCLLLSLIINITLIRGILKIKDVINKMVVTITILNERLNQ